MVVGGGQSDNTQELVRQARNGDQEAVASFFELYRPRLEQMIRLRMDRRLFGRVDPSDVLQDAYFDVAIGLKSHRDHESMPIFLWLRYIVGMRLNQVHRHHLGREIHNANREVSLHHGRMPQASSISIAGQLLGRISSPSQAVIRAETRIKLQEVLNSIDPLDREVLSLRHFEELSNREVAQELGISKTAASNRYVRALKRLRAAMNETPGLFETTS